MTSTSIGIVLINHQKSKSLFIKNVQSKKFEFLHTSNHSNLPVHEQAYNLLKKETGLSKEVLRLFPLVKIQRSYKESEREYFVGFCEDTISFNEELSALWLPVERIWQDSMHFDKQTAFLLDEALHLDHPPLTLSDYGTYIGIDGCRQGWIAAIYHHGKFTFEKFAHLKDFIQAWPSFSFGLIDIMIGLPKNKEEILPETQARKYLGMRSQSLFSRPCFQALNEKDYAAVCNLNQKILGKKISKQSFALFDKIREVQQFFFEQDKYSSILAESHPEICFAALNFDTPLESKKSANGLQQRIELLQYFLKDLSESFLKEKAKELSCNIDDLLDAAVLMIGSHYIDQNGYESFPSKSTLQDSMKILKPDFFHSQSKNTAR
jgi:8-oxo-dGTP diphosphatase